MITIPFGGAQISLTGEGLLWVEGARLLCAADIHFEKSSFFAAFATLLPPYASEETLTRLETAIGKYQPQTFIALGDSFHDRHAGRRLSPDHAARLNHLIAAVPDWNWVIGNHDPVIADHIGGQRSAEYQFQNIIFRHAAVDNETRAEISGHYHPKVTAVIKGHRISAPCFLQQIAGPERLILPAFGALTGGLDINHAALQQMIPVEQRQIYAVQHGQVYRA